MRLLALSLLLLATALLLAGLGQTAPRPQQPRVLAVHFALDVNPATQGYLSSEISRAAREHYAAVVILLDTPGGLSDSMRKIVQSELASPIPVIVYVSPQGARAASAGVWIAEAGDLLAMAPETNIGSSTPIDSSGQNIGSDLRRKVVNDAAASLRALTASHGRNSRWADAAVRKASNLTAAEALRLNVIDMVSPSLPALLKQAEGYRTQGPGRNFTLDLAGAQIDEASPSFFTRLLNVLIDPNIISLLFLAGLAGIGFEIFHPGVVLPGALGAVCLVVALYGFSVLPTDWAGLALVLLGLALLIVDAHVVTHGALTVAGLVALVVGLLLLFHNAPAPYRTSVPLVSLIALLLGGFWAFAIAKAVQIRRRPASVGPQTIVGAEGVVRRPGMAFVNGELWQAEARDGSPLRQGQRVRVESVEGLVLTVSLLERDTSASPGRPALV